MVIKFVIGHLEKEGETCLHEFLDNKDTFKSPVTLMYKNQETTSELGKGLAQLHPDRSPARPSWAHQSWPRPVYPAPSICLTGRLSLSVTVTLFGHTGFWSRGWGRKP